MEQNQSMEVIIHRLAREALQSRRAEAKGSDRELLVELETLSTEVKALMEQLPAEKKHMLETYIEKMELLSERMEIICISRVQKTAWNYSES